MITSPVRYRQGFSDVLFKHWKNDQFIDEIQVENAASENQW